MSSSSGAWPDAVVLHGWSVGGSRVENAKGLRARARAAHHHSAHEGGDARHVGAETTLAGFGRQAYHRSASRRRRSSRTALMISRRSTFGLLKLRFSLKGSDLSLIS